jgi:hypothetical protein
MTASGKGLDPDVPTPRLAAAFALRYDFTAHIPIFYYQVAPIKPAIFHFPGVTD